jgi:hypothetical protein
MKQEFVPYELAVKLKALGFDEPCFGYYSESELVFNTHTNNAMQRFRFAAPTRSQAFRWFRDIHNMFHEIQIDRTTKPKFCYAVFHYEHYGNYEEIKIGEWSLYRTHEEAESACLDVIIEIKSKQDDTRNE